MHLNPIFFAHFFVFDFFSISRNNDTNFPEFEKAHSYFMNGKQSKTSNVHRSLTNAHTVQKYLTKIVSYSTFFSLFTNFLHQTQIIHLHAIENRLQKYFCATFFFISCTHTLDAFFFFYSSVHFDLLSAVIHFGILSLCLTL